MSKFGFDDTLFPPLDIATTARVIAEECRQAWDTADRSIEYWHRRRPAYPIGVFEPLYQRIVETLQQYDALRTEALKTYKQMLMDCVNTQPAPIFIAPGLDKEKKES